MMCYLLCAIITEDVPADGTGCGGTGCGGIGCGGIGCGGTVTVQMVRTCS